MCCETVQIHKIYYLMCLLVLAGGCADDVPTFEGPPVDSPIECVEGEPPTSSPDAAAAEDAAPAPGDAGAGDEQDASMDASASSAPAASSEPAGCSAQEVCIRGRCHPRCAGDSDCSRAEMCDGSTGRCVERTVPLPDATVDASLPCEGVECAEGLLCHPTAAECVQCTVGEAAACDAVGFCDFGTGACVAPSMQPCSPCDRSSDCSSGYSCEDRTGGSIGEKVCLLACPAEDAGMCPSGMPCNEVTGYCEPAVSTCTNWRASTEGVGCEQDRDCFSLASYPGGVIAGACLSGTDGGAPRCQIPCTVGMDGQCPAGRVCGDSGFCGEMAP